jgi:hypothetical protein
VADLLDDRVVLFAEEQDVSLYRILTVGVQNFTVNVKTMHVSIRDSQTYQVDSQKFSMLPISATAWLTFCMRKCAFKATHRH